MPERTAPTVIGTNAIKLTTMFSKPNDHAILDPTADTDEKVLAALGYKQEFKNFSLWDSFSVSFALLGLLPSVASTIGYSLGYSGTGGAVWGWLIASLCIQATAFSMAELCSSMPTAGGLYYASAVLAPEGWGPMCSWFVGWSNFCGYVTGPCSINYALASMLVTCGEITNPSYAAQPWHIYLLMLLLITLQGLIAMQPTETIGLVNKIGTVWNLVIILIFVIWFPVGSINLPATNHSRAVWTTFENGTEWPIGWATVMGFLTTIWTMSGYDTPFHLSEECSNANLASPRAIIMTAQGGLYLGFAIILVIAYTVKDIPDVVAGAYGQPFGSLCLQVLGKKAGLAMFALTIVAQFFVGLGCVVTSTRVCFSFARDGALPASGLWRRVDARTKTPVWATWGVSLVAALLGLLIFAGPVAIGAVFSIGAIAQYTSFTVPIALKLFFDRGRFKRGPWHLGHYSKPLNIAAVAWWCLITPALCFPAVRGQALTPQTMNWTIVIYGGVMALAMTYYAFLGKNWFTDPKINVEHVNESPTGGSDVDVQASQQEFGKRE